MSMDGSMSWTWFIRICVFVWLPSHEKTSVLTQFYSCNGTMKQLLGDTRFDPSLVQQEVDLRPMTLGQSGWCRLKSRIAWSNVKKFHPMYTIKVRKAKGKYPPEQNFAKLFAACISRARFHLLIGVRWQSNFVGPSAFRKGAQSEESSVCKWGGERALTIVQAITSVNAILSYSQSLGENGRKGGQMPPSPTMYSITFHQSGK